MILSSSYTLLDGTNSNLSSTASVAAYIGDAFSLSLSIQSSTGSASRYTILGSIQDGLQSTLSVPQLVTGTSGDWSVVTTITAQGIYSLNTAIGMRWIAAFRDNISVSASSNVTFRLTQQIHF